MRFLFGACNSASLSSSFCFFFLLPPLDAVVDVTLFSLNEADCGVGAWEAGVDPPEAVASYGIVSRQLGSVYHGPSRRKEERTSVEMGG